MRLAVMPRRALGSPRAPGVVLGWPGARLGRPDAHLDWLCAPRGGSTAEGRAIRATGAWVLR